MPGTYYGIKHGVWASFLEGCIQFCVRSLTLSSDVQLMWNFIISDRFSINKRSGSLWLREFVQTISSTFGDGFQNNLTELFSITCICAIWNIRSGRPKVKVTLEDQIFAWIISPTILDGFWSDLTQLFSLMSTCISAIWNFYSTRLKVKVMRARQVVHGQRSSFLYFSYMYIVVSSSPVFDFPDFRSACLWWAKHIHHKSNSAYVSVFVHASGNPDLYKP